jgi:hypothetical protein
MMGSSRLPRTTLIPDYHKRPWGRAPTARITALRVVACTGTLVTASENSNPEARPTLKLRTETGDQVLLPLSEQTTRQLQEVISQFNRTRDLVFVEERAPDSATLQ